MSDNTDTIFIIDDDLSVRRSLTLFLKSSGYNVESFSSSENYLERERYEGIGCLILDVNLEGKSGLELQDELTINDSHLPIIFITGRGNIQMSVSTLKKGAINFLEKPFKDEDLLQSVTEALTISRKLKSDKETSRIAHSLINKLTARENEIFINLLTGMLNKQIASKFKIAEQTVKLHRLKICEKLGVKSVAEMIRVAEQAGIKF
jgi:FixJ family two-component response regulator